MYLVPKPTEHAPLATQPTTDVTYTHPLGSQINWSALMAIAQKHQIRAHNISPWKGRWQSLRFSFY